MARTGARSGANAPSKAAKKPTLATGPSSTIQPRGSRACFSKGKAILPPSESSLQGHLTFTTKARKQKYTEVCKLSILPGKCIDYSTLTELGIRYEFDALVDGIGWRKFFDITCPVFVELTREFYTTFQFASPDNFTLDSPNVVQYRLMGKEFKRSITEFNLDLGIITPEDISTESYSTSRVDYDDAFIPVVLWSTMSVDKYPYDPSQSKGTYLRKLAWQYVHRFFAFSYSCRKASSVTFTKAEFFFLWAMVNGVKVNLGCWLASQIQSVLNKHRALILGHVITHMAINLDLLDIEHTNMYRACEMEPLNLKSLERMGIVEFQGAAYHFRPPGAPLPPAQLRENLKRGRAQMSEPSADETDISTSDTPSPTTVDLRLEHLESKLTRIEANLDAFFRFMKFQPPHPASP